MLERLIFSLALASHNPFPCWVSHQSLLGISYRITRELRNQVKVATLSSHLSDVHMHNPCYAPRSRVQTCCREGGRHRPRVFVTVGRIDTLGSIFTCNRSWSFGPPLWLQRSSPESVPRTFPIQNLDPISSKTWSTPQTSDS